MAPCYLYSCILSHNFTICYLISEQSTCQNQNADKFSPLLTVNHWKAIFKWRSTNFTCGSRWNGEGSGTPVQYPCLENPMDGGAWWAAVHGVAEGQTRQRLHFHFSLSCIGEGNGNPLQCSCLENPREGGAWWVAVSGVAQSQTRLKWLSIALASRWKEFPKQ